eukprot:4526913-Amphidinium_carterae.1
MEGSGMTSLNKGGALASERLQSACVDDSEIYSTPLQQNCIYLLKESFSFLFVYSGEVGLRNSSKRLKMATLSLSTDCLQEELCSSFLEDCWTEKLSSSDEEDFTWERLGPTRRPLAFQTRGFASEQEEWDFYCSLANHVAE